MQKKNNNNNNSSSSIACYVTSLYTTYWPDRYYMTLHVYTSKPAQTGQSRLLASSIYVNVDNWWAYHNYTHNLIWYCSWSQWKINKLRDLRRLWILILERHSWNTHANQSNVLYNSLGLERKSHNQFSAGNTWRWKDMQRFINTSVN